MKTPDARIFVVDDDASVRSSLARLLRSAGWLVEEFRSAQDFLARLPFEGMACVVLDVQMPGMHGPELYQKLREAGVMLPVIYLTGHGDIPTGVDAMKRGAVDFLLKPVDDELLLATIQRALDHYVAANLREGQKRLVRAGVDRLSLRERQVMEHVIGGRLNKQIAADLGITEKTVKVHRARAMEKMGARSVAELVRLCEMVGITPP